MKKIIKPAFSLFFLVLIALACTAPFEPASYGNSQNQSFEFSPAGQATLEALNIRVTEQAIQFEATRQAATITADQANSTATAVAQAAGTARAETEMVQAAKAASAATTREAAELAPWRTFWRFALAGCFVASVIAAVVLLFKLLPWIQLRFFGAQRWNGKPLLVVPDGQGGALIADISRSLGPGLSLDVAAREIASKGIFQNALLQDQVAARAQAAEMLLAAQNGAQPPEGGRQDRLIQRTLQSGNEAGSQPFQILPLQGLPPQQLVAIDTIEILDAEWRAIDE